MLNGENVEEVSTIAEPVKTSKGKIQPARGVSVTESGEVILTAHRTSKCDSLKLRSSRKWRSRGFQGMAGRKPQVP